jgi:hypothetical protein
MALIESPEPAARLARAIASDVTLYNEAEIVQWVREGRMPDKLAEALAEGRTLFDARVAASLHDGGRCFLKSLLPIFEKVIDGKGGPRPPDLTSSLERALGVAIGSTPPTAAAASLTVKVGSAIGDGTLSFFAAAFVVERVGFGDIKDTTELPYADVEELRVGRGPLGCELTVRVRFAEHRFTMTPADAIAAAQRLLPFAAGQR